MERDIVGHDVYGMIHHLFNPTAEYHRYWDPCEMSKEELDYGKKIGLLALLDLPLFSPLIWTGNAGIDIGKNHQISFTTGYALTPFGDMIDERFYYGYYGFENPIRVSFYARQYGNRYKYFPAFGIKLIQYSPISWLSITASGDFWIQPENLDFNTKTGKSGGAGEIKLMFFPPNQNNKNGDFGVSLGVLAKSKGFLPSVESHDDYWRISAGVSYRPKNNK